MAKLKIETKAKILAAAEEVFHENGFKGARTTLIAKRAGVSRTMLHYYYRTKEDLFREILESSFGFFIKKAGVLFSERSDLKNLIESIIDLLIDIMSEKPGLPSFMVNVLNESPELMLELPFIQDEKMPPLFDKLLNDARSKNQINSDITGENLLLNIYGLCSIPFLSAPLIKHKENRTKADMNLFIKERKEGLKVFVWNGLKH